MCALVANEYCLIHTIMLNKSVYSTPEAELLEIRFEGSILSNVEKVTVLSGDAGEWDDDV